MLVPVGVGCWFSRCSFVLEQSACQDFCLDGAAAAAGLINQVLLKLGLIDVPLTLIYNRVGVVIGMVHILLPFMILPLYSVLIRIDASYTSAAASLGAPPVQNFLRIYLPLSLPGVLTGTVLVFVIGLGYYITPALLGGPGDTMIAQILAMEVADFGRWGLAGAVALVLLLGTSVIFMLVQTHPGINPMTVIRIHSGTWWTITRTLVCALIVVYLIAPMIIVLIISFSSAPFLAFPPPGLSLQWYRKLFGDPEWLGSLITSVQIMLPTGIMATVLRNGGGGRGRARALSRRLDRQQLVDGACGRPGHHHSRRLVRCLRWLRLEWHPGWADPCPHGAVGPLRHCNCIGIAACAR